ncbi:MAG: branched-chain amino acid ABC transporter permease [Actinomycetota bacterium]|nr:branched-chain amino acid ABC transporter permease [Actinomycetota bacterium]
MTQFMLGIGFGLVTAAIVALSTVALSLQFSVTRTINFAHGELMTVGAYAGYVVAQHTSNLVPQALAAVAAGALLGWILNWGLLRRFTRRGASKLVLFVLTVATALIVQNLLQIGFGGSYVNYRYTLGAAHHVGPFLWTTLNIVTMVVAAVILVSLHLMISRTRFGKAQRAVADDPMLARTSGIAAERIISLTWVLDGGIAGLAGMFLALQVGSFTPTLGFSYLLVIFSAAIVGGIGRMYGAMLGSLIIGIVMEVSAIYINPSYKETMAFLILVVVLLFRPQGILPALSEG